MARNTAARGNIHNWSGVNSSTIRANAIPTKPVCTPNEVSMWDQTRRVWEVRAKDSLALRRAGLLAELTQPAATANTTTTTPNPEPIDLTGTSSTNGDSDKENSSCRPRSTATAAAAITTPVAATTLTAAASSRNLATLPRRKPATTTATPKRKSSSFDAILFRPNNAGGINKRRAGLPTTPNYSTPAARRAAIAERQRQERRLERTRVDQLREGVDARLLLCNPNLRRRQTSEEEEKTVHREEAVYQMAKTLTKRGALDAPKSTGWGGRMNR